MLKPVPGWNTVCMVPASRATPLTTSWSATPLGATRSDSVPIEVWAKVPLIWWVTPAPAALMPIQPLFSKRAEEPAAIETAPLITPVLNTRLPEAVESVWIAKVPGTALIVP